MCGIIGIVGASPVQGRLIESLKRLEYRGYDSAGIAGHVDGRIERRRAAGKLKNLEAVLEADPLPAQVGIGHTRWATHGAPTEANAHPHIAGRVALVHNGIIENFAELKAELIGKGHRFASETDSEVVAHLLDEALKSAPPAEALKATLARLEGAYALVAMIDGEDSLLLGARHGPPLVVGYGKGEMYLGSDALAVGPFTNRVAYLEDGDCVLIDREGAKIFAADGRPAER
ncbi:MAG: glutamine--fructose-6-phosphate aminotransferase, partial [Caulobacter sp.]